MVSVVENRGDPPPLGACTESASMLTARDYTAEIMSNMRASEDLDS